MLWYNIFEGTQKLKHGEFVRSGFDQDHMAQQSHDKY